MNIGLVAHDTKKELMLNFCIAYKKMLGKHDLYSTGTTGKLISDNCNLPVHILPPGHLGGGRQMSALIECNQLDAVFYFREPVDQRVREMDYSRVNKLCDIYNIPLATNIATAEILIMAIDRGDLDWRNAYK
ncbi:MAG: methylglyoxal synthase [Parasporobacterium sp.]|nr:methylglyoxal synthase [Parasporobacterium sp.]